MLFHLIHFYIALMNIFKLYDVGCFNKNNTTVQQIKSRYTVKKRFFTKPKKDLTAGTRAEPHLVSSEEGSVWNFSWWVGKMVLYTRFLTKPLPEKIQKTLHARFGTKTLKKKVSKVS